MNNLYDTLALIHDMHAGMNDWTGVPYATHPVAVMLLLPPECTVDDQHLALLHDVIEDCSLRLSARFNLDSAEPVAVLEAMASRYSPYVLHGLKLLSRNMWPGMTYMQYIENIVASGHRGAMWVKYCDNMHNTDPFRRARLLPEKQIAFDGLDRRYSRSKSILREGLGIKTGENDAISD